MNNSIEKHYLVITNKRDVNMYNENYIILRKTEDLTNGKTPHVYNSKDLHKVTLLIIQMLLLAYPSGRLVFNFNRSWMVLREAQKCKPHCLNWVFW